MMRASKEKAKEHMDYLGALKSRIINEGVNANPDVTQCRRDSLRSRRANLRTIEWIADFIEAAYHKLPSEADYDREQARKRLREKRRKEVCFVEGWL